MASNLRYSRSEWWSSLPPKKSRTRCLLCVLKLHACRVFDRPETLAPLPKNTPSKKSMHTCTYKIHTQIIFYLLLVSANQQRPLLHFWIKVKFKYHFSCLREMEKNKFNVWALYWFTCPSINIGEQKIYQRDAIGEPSPVITIFLKVHIVLGH